MQEKELIRRREEQESGGRGESKENNDKEKWTKATRELENLLSESRERRRGLEEENKNLKRDKNDLSRNLEAERAESNRVRTEMNIVRVNSEKAKKIGKEKLERTESDLMGAQKQISDLIDKMKEYERRYGYLNDIRQEEEEMEKKEREVRERQRGERECPERDELVGKRERSLGGEK